MSPSQPRALNWPLLRLGRLQRFRAALVPGTTLLVIILAGLFAPFLAPYDPNAIDMQIALAGPDWAHPLGTDQLGRDHLSRLLYGGQATLLLSGFGTLVIIAIGLLVGVVSGYIGGFVDTLVSTLLTVLLALPNLLLTLAILGILGPGTESLLIALIGAGWVGHARVFRSSILALREQAFVEVGPRDGLQPAADYDAPSAAEPAADRGDLGDARYRRAAAADLEPEFLGVGRAAAHCRLGCHAPTMRGPFSPMNRCWWLRRVS